MNASKTPKWSDCVWYWDGGREVGTWRKASAGTREAIERAGRVAHDGSTAIGAPDGPPSDEQFRRVGFL